MTTTKERTGLLRRRPKPPEITTPPAGTVLPAHVRTGAPDIPVTSATPALPPGWEPADARLPGLPAQPDPRGASARRTAEAAEPAHAPAAADGAQLPQGPPAPDNESRTAEAPDAPAKGSATIPIPVNALQAMCRQVFGFRLAMIALAAPAALVNAAPGVATRLVGAAVVVTFMFSYVLFRDWERFGPLLLRHPGEIPEEFEVLAADAGQNAVFGGDHPDQRG